MPYIKQQDREKFNSSAKDIADKASCAGDLNYALTVIIQSYIEKKGLNYANCNEIVGMLDCCKMEFYRKIVAPYEEKKINENGDVSIITNVPKGY